MMFPWFTLPDMTLLRNGMMLEAQARPPGESRDRCLEILEDIDRDIMVKTKQQESDERR